MPAQLSGALDGYTHDSLTFEGKTRDVYRTGSGPAVIVIAEIPGITPKVAEFGRKVAAIGCTAVLPRLFGDPGREPSAVYALQSIVPACVSKEFAALAAGRTSPVTTWLRALARQAHAECGGPGVGVIGMCFTGGFALAMMIDDIVLAPVLSQPSLPFPLSKKHRRDLGISDQDLARVKQRCETEDLCVLGMRFTGDRVVPAERFQRLREELGDKFIAVEIEPDDYPAGVGKHPHSVVTEHLHQPSLEKVLQLFRDKLLS